MGENYWNKTGKRGPGALEGWLQGAEAEEVVYKTTFNLQTHVDVREIAMLDAFLRKLGWNPRGQSDLARTAIDLVVNAAKQEGMTIPETEEALEYLESYEYSLGQFKRAGRQRRRIKTAMQRDNLVRETRSTSQASNWQGEQESAYIPMPPVTPEDEYDKWGRWRMDKLLGEGLSEADAIEQAMRECNEKRETDDNEHPEVRLEVLIWSFCSSGMTPDGAKMRAEMRLKQEKEMGRRL
jgi:hypothetical protein